MACRASAPNATVGVAQPADNNASAPSVTAETATAPRRSRGPAARTADVARATRASGRTVAATSSPRTARSSRRSRRGVSSCTAACRARTEGRSDGAISQAASVSSPMMVRAPQSSSYSEPLPRCRGRRRTDGGDRGSALRSGRHPPTAPRDAPARARRRRPRAPPAPAPADARVDDQQRRERGGRPHQPHRRQLDGAEHEPGDQRRRQRDAEASPRDRSSRRAASAARCGVGRPVADTPPEVRPHDPGIEGTIEPAYVSGWYRASGFASTTGVAPAPSPRLLQSNPYAGTGRSAHRGLRLVGPPGGAAG